MKDLSDFAARLAEFLLAFHRVDPSGGPLPGPQNFYRGGPLSVYDAETRQALATLKNKIDGETAIEVWESALSTSWENPPVWVHGDISLGNLLVKEDHLSAFIDFGQLAVGDPACDLVIAWTFFEGKSRDAFRKALQLDAGTWARARAWALWKALIVAADLAEKNNTEGAQCCAYYAYSPIEGITFYLGQSQDAR